MAYSPDRPIETTIDRMTGRTETVHRRTVRRLHELIAALDRRVPQVQRAGELSIARAAAALRIEALTRIDELESKEAAAADPGNAG
jgi:hypothetical protein